MQVKDIGGFAGKIRDNIEKVVIGKSREIDIILSALFANGHALLEDVPGTGKTMLAKALAKSFGCSFSRIQFTPDLLPSDLTGLSFYSPKTGEFSFRKGALFTNILLADEINRATPRTQSGLLESMEEKQITVDGVTYKLEPPYFVIATQNPVETQGTYPLPEAQLDRFLVRLLLGYPTTGESVGVLKRFMKSNPLNEIEPVCDAATLVDIQKTINDVFVHEDMMAYIVEITEKTRSHESIALGVSTRGSIALMNISKAYAAVKGREFITPDDVQTLVPYVYAHRIIHKGGIRSHSSNIQNILSEIIEGVKAPTENWK